PSASRTCANSRVSSGRDKSIPRTVAPSTAPVGSIVGIAPSPKSARMLRLRANPAAVFLGACRARGRALRLEDRHHLDHSDGSVVPADSYTGHALEHFDDSRAVFFV